MSTGLYTLRKTYVDGDTLSASDYVADHQQHIDNQNPQETGALSDNLSQYRATADTGDVGSESLAAALDGELERIRFVLQDIKTKIHGASVAQWYSKSYAVAIGTTGINNGAVTTPKLAEGATFLQFLRNTSSNVLISGGEPTLVSQAITLARTRVRIKVFVTMRVGNSGAGSSGSTFTITLKRGSTSLGTCVLTPSDIASGFNCSAYDINLVDTPGAGTFTYNVTCLTSDSLISSVNNFSEITLEEIV